MTSRKAIITALLDRHGQSFCGELGIDRDLRTPSPLFRWLCASILYSARIQSGVATKAARALGEAGLTTAAHMKDASWKTRVGVLNRSGFARFDESYASILGDAADHIADEYDGDLRKLRENAERDPAQERKRLKTVKGLGDVGVDIFCRETQAAWPELHPFADQKALKSADLLGLETDTARLAKGLSKPKFVVLVAALVRADLAKSHDEILSAARA